VVTVIDPWEQIVRLVADFRLRYYMHPNTILVGERVMRDFMEHKSTKSRMKYMAPLTTMYLTEIVGRKVIIVTPDSTAMTVALI
jgi:hypothetical protein